MVRLLFAMALACGRLNGDDTTGGGGDVPLDQLGAQLAHAECTQMFKCCDLADREKLLAGFGSNADIDESECEFQFGSAVQNGLVPVLQSSISAGSAAYSQSAAGNCIAALESDSCDAFSQTVAAASSDATLQFGCPDVIIPLEGQGTSCTQNYECETHNCIENICDPEATVGEPCNGTCESGAFCDFNAGDICEKQKPDFDSCGSDAECTSGHCIGSGSTTGSCESAPAICS